MREITRTPLEDIRLLEEQMKAKDQQLQGLGFSLSQEKIKNVQKDAMVGSLGQQLAMLKIEVANMKGDAGL